MSGDPKAITIKGTVYLQTVLDKMLDHEEDILPVVNGERRVLGDLKLSEVLLKVIEANKTRE